ncbi:MAG: serine hydrolase [Clostridia bacterium]|nr:serine hydrolase [Clostridia bacterium]
MNYCTPEKMGISSENILKYLKTLEDRRLATHDVIIMRGDNIVCEAYWKPFHKDFLHRMYSVTKSFVGIAVGFLEQDGLIELDDEIAKYFPEEMAAQTDENMRHQTIRNMLMMSTAKIERYWFTSGCTDRVKYYFENDNKESRPAGTIFQYDSTGSFVLGALVERLTGKTLLDYLREKFLDKIGFSKEAYMLKCPGGHSWSDSALLCTPADLLKVAKFMMNKGKWNGGQILNEKYATDATSDLITCTSINDCQFESHGYGYLIWRTHDNSFFFNGMGCQLAVCVPDKDMILIYNADNQGKTYAKDIIIDNFFDMIVRTAEDEELPENMEANKKLNDMIENLTLAVAIGEKSSPTADKINGKTYKMDYNPMGIEKIKFTFDADGGVFHYTNEQGDKEIPFKFGENAFHKFPQEGYSDMVGTEKSGILYDCASSAAWIRENVLQLKVQVIDKYFGNLHAVFNFRNDIVGVRMNKIAENFMNEYHGYAGGKAID